MQDLVLDFNRAFNQRKELFQAKSLFENEVLEKELDGINVEKEKDRLLEIFDSERQLHTELISTLDRIPFNDQKAKKEFLYELFDNSIQEKDWTNILILIWLLQEQNFDSLDSIKLCSFIESLLSENELIVELDKGVVEYSNGIFIEDLLKLIKIGLPNSSENRIIKDTVRKIVGTLNQDIENNHALVFAKNTYSYIKNNEKSA